MRRVRRWLGLGLVSLCIFGTGMPRAEAGPVNSPGSYPFAVSNVRGDRLTLGDLKGLVYWQDNQEERAAALRWKTSPSIKQRFSGGIAEATDRAPSAAAAIACSEQQSLLYDNQRSPAAPAGLWRDADTWGAAPNGRRHCSMRKDGQFAEFFVDSSVLLINRKFRVSLKGNFVGAELLVAADNFLLVNAKGQAASIFFKQGQWQASDVWLHGLGSFSSDARFVGNDHLVLKAEADGNLLAKIAPTADGIRLEPKQRLPVNPCEDNQVCGLSLAADDSWVISGYWGHYLGRGQQFVRLKIPLSVLNGSGGVAIAHSAQTGAFIYLGWDDGDRGVLPGLPTLSSTDDRSAVPQRWMIWRKPRTGADRPLLSIQIPTSSQQALARTSEMMEWRGELPSPRPKEWLAWEAAVEISVLMPAASLSVVTDLWWLDRTGAREAQDLVKKAGISPVPIHVAVIDSGIDTEHPLLQRQLDRRVAEIAGNGLDDDNNGFVDDTFGYDFVEEDADPQDEFGHGTHVAGLLAAQSSDSELRNPAPNVRLTVVRALDRSGKSNSIDLARGLLYAADNGAEVVNCSWGGGSDTQALRDSFAALKDRGLVVFSSAGNDKVDTDKNPEVPKTYPGVRSIAATGQSNQLASFSNFGRNSVRFLAPGDAIISTVIGGGLGEKSGTSMASPIAAASFAFVLGVYRALHPQQLPGQQIEAVDQVLCQSAERKGLENRSQCGLIRIQEAIKLLLP